LRLFRQSRRADWADVFLRIADALRLFSARNSRSRTSGSGNRAGLRELVAA
jgi:hypothetical protein